MLVNPPGASYPRVDRPGAACRPRTDDITRPLPHPSTLVSGSRPGKPRNSWIRGETPLMTTQKELAEPEVQHLIDMGKQRGYVTYEEMNNFLPTHLVSSERLDDVMIMFSDMDIEIVNEARKRAEAERRGAPKPGEEAKP